MKDCFVNKSRSRTALTNVEHLDKDTHAAHNSYVRLSEHLDKDALADVRLEHPPWRVMSRRVARVRRAPRVLLLRPDEELARDTLNHCRVGAIRMLETSRQHPTNVARLTQQHYVRSAAARRRDCRDRCSPRRTIHHDIRSAYRTNENEHHSTVEIS